jgi:nucleotide-binding universal stress UspA family protein
MRRRAKAPQLPLVESILHPTDFSDGSESAFAHALAVALLRQTHLTLLHVSAQPIEQGWSQFPPVRKTLERWGLLEPGSPRSAVYRELGVRVQKVAAKGRNPAQAILEQIEKEPVELIVLATEGRDGIPRWLRGSVAESVARDSDTMTLFVPRGARGFVGFEDGELSLRRILVPVAVQPSGQAAVQFAARAAALIGEEDVEIVLVHVGDEMPELQLPPESASRFKEILREGEIEDEIVAAAGEMDADLVVMVTEGPNSLIDALRGTTTENVLRRVACPVLTVPVQWLRSVAAGRLTG